MDEFAGQAFDMVITMCEDAEDECPVWLGKGKKLHQPYPDPAKAAGSNEEILQAFRQVRDEIAGNIVPLLAGANPGSTLPSGRSGASRLP